MPRPSINTKEGQEAVRKYRRSMIKKYGGEEGYEMAMKMRGSKGGQKKGVKKGFAAHPELAVIAGRKGGRISRRTCAPKQEREKLWNGEEI
jgi:general stress protein YciG